MKAGFYPKLALDGIRKNRRLFVPYILTCIGMVMMEYIVLYLRDSPALASMPGVETVREILNLGVFVIALFAVLFLFYTNSFLLRRRKKEFGLYNVLGMGKRNIGRILFWETLCTAVIAVALGLGGGIVLSKLAELVLVKIMRGRVSYALWVSVPGIVIVAAVFGVIFALLFFRSLWQVHRFGAVSLLRSENVGEKPPKGNLFFGLLGLLLLLGAYWLSVTIRDPIAAIAIFFLAVCMVILGTYLVMIAGSVLLCRLLQKKKSYYYRANHFVSVSSMVYRMKRNGAGLASICILATMVLVMLSSTACLYFGGEDALRSRYPRQLAMEFGVTDLDGLSDRNVGTLRDAILDTARTAGAEPENIYEYRYAYVTGCLRNGAVETDVRRVESLGPRAALWQFYWMPLADYNAMTGSSETLKAGEALLCTYGGSYRGDSIAFRNGATLRIRRQVRNLAAIGDIPTALLPGAVLVVPDLEQGVAGLDRLADYNGDSMLSYRWAFHFDTQLPPDGQTALVRSELTMLWESDLRTACNIISYSCGGREADRADYYALYGGFFYLGILLSIVFLFAAVLIMYYKQISEGYEDQARFAIMQKIGMTKREIRQSINSQLLTVFYLPLLLAAVHLGFAFPILRKLLLLFNLHSVALFACTTALSVAAFALFYMLMYRITSNAYYRIVSGASQP